jgi:hypothetical protein
VIERLQAAEPFPTTGFQITIEKFSTDDPPCYEQEQTSAAQSLGLFRTQEIENNGSGLAFLSPLGVCLVSHHFK